MNKLSIVLGILCAWGVIACSATDGKMVTATQLAHKTCTADTDCAPNGYCETDPTITGEEGNRCMMQCTSGASGSTLCDFYYQTGSNCVNNRCVVPEDGDTDSATDTEDDSESEVVLPTGTGADCKYWTPADAKAKGLNHPDDTNPIPGDLTYGDKDCVRNGWYWTCQSDNKCHSDGAVNYGNVDATKSANKWVGVWAGMYTTAATTTGLPIVSTQDTVSAHNLLMRVRQDGDNLIFDTRICRITIWNFDDKGANHDLSYMSTPIKYTDHIVMARNVLTGAPDLVAGATFKTSASIEIRGAVLSNPNCGTDADGNLYLNSDYTPVLCGSDVDTSKMYPGNPANPPCCAEALPSRLDVCKSKGFTSARPKDGCPIDVDGLSMWDQDEDGYPAMTSQMMGLLTGDVYSVQRYQMAYDGEVVDHKHIKGMLPTFNEQYQMGSSNATLISTTQSIPYNYDMKDGVGSPHDRNYFRFMRVPANWSCDDIINEADNNPTSYIRFSLHRDEVCLVDNDCQLRNPGYVCKNTSCVAPTR